MGQVKRVYEAITELHYRISRLNFISEIESVPDWRDLPFWLKDDMLACVVFVIENPDADGSAAHAFWMDLKLAAGWNYGRQYNEEAKETELLVPYEELPKVRIAANEEFRASVKLIYGFTEQLLHMPYSRAMELKK